jgi:hypothetical protein
MFYAIRIYTSRIPHGFSSTTGDAAKGFYSPALDLFAGRIVVLIAFSNI